MPMRDLTQCADIAVLLVESMSGACGIADVDESMNCQTISIVTKLCSASLYR